MLFKPLRLEEIESIVDLLVAQLRLRLADRQLTLELTPAARAQVARRGFDPVYGARPLKRYLQREVETRIGRAIIAGDVIDGSRLTVDVGVDGELEVRHEAPPAPPPTDAGPVEGEGAEPTEPANAG